jgi:hypothetical protein
MTILDLGFLIQDDSKAPISNPKAKIQNGMGDR